jgi:two-component system sensor histidine kinase BaeS
MAETRIRRISPLRVLLLMAFVAVSLVSLGVLLALAAWGATPRLTELDSIEHLDAASITAEQVARAYRESGGWAGIHLTEPMNTARSRGAHLTVADDGGNRIIGPPTGDGGPTAPEYLGAAPSAEAAVVAEGTTVGTVTLTFVDHQALAVSRWVTVMRLVGWAALAGLGVATLVAWVVSGWLLRPVHALTDSATQFGRGDRGARAGHHDLPGELGQLAREFDVMADTVAEQEAARHRLVADISHDLRAPLGTLQAELEELSDGLVPATPERLSAVHEQSVRLGRIVADLSAVDQGGSSRGLIVSRVDLSRLVESCLAAKETQMRTGGITVSRTLHEAFADVDSDRVVEVVGNLVDNVVRYCPSGSTVAVTTALADGDAIIIVEDDGPGVAQVDLGHILERHYRGENSSTVTGSGLGLAVADELVRAHGGTIRVGMGEQGRGTRVVVTLPAAVPASRVT